MTKSPLQRRHFLLGIPCIALAGKLGIPGGSAQAAKPDLEKYREAAVERWEEAITELEARDQSENHPDESILFVGSSSIRRWDNIRADLAPYHPIRRGYGGAKWSDVAIFADRLITPHKFRAAVFFVGNDIVGKETDKSPEEVAALFKYVLERLRRHNSNAPVFFIAVTPTAKRLAAWPRIKAANTAVRELCAQHDNLYFIGTESTYLDGEGQPRNELFVEDKLHLNPAGYTLWAAIIKSHLDTVLDGA